MKVLISRVVLLFCFGYAFEALLLGIGWLKIPGLATMIGISQIPSIAWAIGKPSPAEQRSLLTFMFVVQGFVFSVIAVGVWGITRLGKSR